MPGRDGCITNDPGWLGYDLGEFLCGNRDARQNTANASSTRKPCQVLQSKVGHSHTSISIAKASASPGEWPAFGEQVDVYTASIRPSRDVATAKNRQARTTVN